MFASDGRTTRYHGYRLSYHCYWYSLTVTRLVFTNPSMPRWSKTVELFSEIGELKRYSVNYDKDGKSQVHHGLLSSLFCISLRVSFCIVNFSSTFWIREQQKLCLQKKVDALDAIMRYDGVLLDGKPMKVDLIGNNSEPSPTPPTAPLLYNPPFPNYNIIPNSVPQRDGQRGRFQGSGRPGNSQDIGGGPRGIFQGSGRPGSSSQGNGGHGQWKLRGYDRYRVQKSASDLDAELDQYHAEAVKQK
ncbi:hypothetical protein ABZP36_000608 [Zizania latifolia]